MGRDKPAMVGDSSLISPTQLASSFRGKRINQTFVAKERDASVKLLGISSDFEKLGPAAKTRKLAESPHPLAVVSNFLRTGAQLNMLRQVQDSLSSVSAAIQCYGAFCDLMDVQYFPLQLMSRYSGQPFSRPAERSACTLAIWTRRVSCLVSLPIRDLQLLSAPLRA